MNITINEKEYDTDTFTPEQTLMFNHAQVLQQKQQALEFDLQQTTVAKDAFVAMLVKALEAA